MRRVSLCYTPVVPFSVLRSGHGLQRNLRRERPENRPLIPLEPMAAQKQVPPPASEAEPYALIDDTLSSMPIVPAYQHPAQELIKTTAAASSVLSWPPRPRAETEAEKIIRPREGVPGTRVDDYAQQAHALIAHIDDLGGVTATQERHLHDRQQTNILPMGVAGDRGGVGEVPQPTFSLLKTTGAASSVLSWPPSRERAAVPGTAFTASPVEGDAAAAGATAAGDAVGGRGPSVGQASSILGPPPTQHENDDLLGSGVVRTRQHDEDRQQTLHRDTTARRGSPANEHRQQTTRIASKRHDSTTRIASTTRIDSSDEDRSTTRIMPTSARTDGDHGQKPAVLAVVAGGSGGSVRKTDGSGGRKHSHPTGGIPTGGESHEDRERATSRQHEDEDRPATPRQHEDRPATPRGSTPIFFSEDGSGGNSGGRKHSHPTEDSSSVAALPAKLTNLNPK